MPVYKNTKNQVLAGSSLSHVAIIDNITQCSLKQDMYILQHAKQHLPPEQQQHEQEKQRKTDLKRALLPANRRAFKNLIVLSSAFMIVYTAFVSLQTLQSTLNAHQGIGVTSLSCIYAAQVVSCLFSPWIISRLKIKWSIAAAFAMFIVYILTNFYPEDYVIIPTALLLGLLSGPMWSSQSTYLTTLAIQYAQSMEQLNDLTISKFNGIFCGIFQLSQIWGNIVTTVVLSENHTVHLNSVNLTGVRLEHCGAKDCGGLLQYQDFTNIPHFLAHVPPNVYFMLLSTYIGCALVGIIIIIVLLDKNELNLAESAKTPSLVSSQNFFYSTLRLLQDHRLQLLIPLVVYTGLEQGFVLGDFTKVLINSLFLIQPTLALPILL